MKSSYIIKTYYLILVTTVLLLLTNKAACQYGYALGFNKAASQYITVPHNASLNLGATFTLEATVNYTGVNLTIVDKGDYDFLWSLNPNDSSGKMGFYNGNSSSWVYSNSAVPQGVTTHVAIVGNAGSVTFYINGIASGTAVAAARQDGLPMNIGRQQPSSCQCNFFNGIMDELRIWNMARTQAQIFEGINSSVPVNSSGLVAYYKFDEGGGNPFDASGNGNHGTLVNGPTWEKSVASAQGGVGIGTNTPSGNAILEISSKNKGLMLPRLSDTTAVQNPTAGLIIYNNSAKSPAFYDGTSWQTLLNTANDFGGGTDSIVCQFGPNNASLTGGYFPVESIFLGGSAGEDRFTTSIVMPRNINTINLQKQFMLNSSISGQLEVLVYKKGASTASYTYKFTNTKIVANTFAHSQDNLPTSVAYYITADKLGYKDVANNISFGWSYVSPVGLTTY